MNLVDKKLELLELANAWYDGTDFEPISDLEFDLKEREILSEDPTWDYRKHLSSQGKDFKHYYPMDKVSKMQETERSMEEVYTEMNLDPDSDNSPKYDGGGLCLYYNEGVIYDALTRSSQVSGKRQFSKIVSMVPNVIEDKDIVAIECEAICTLDKGHGDLSRQAATGLLNSNSLQDRCENEVTIVAFKVRFKDGVTKDWVQATKDLPTVRVKINPIDGKVHKFETNITFIPTPFNEGKYEGNKFYCDSFTALIDGIVEYKDGKSLAHKLYFNEKKVSIITKIEWNHTESSLKYVPKYIYETVNVDGTDCSRATGGGTAQLKKMKCGFGAQVEIIKAGLTIPQVKGLVPGTTGSEDYSLPTTCGCGEKLTWRNELNGGLYCPNPKCSVNLNILQKYLDETGLPLSSFIFMNPVTFIEKFLKVPRFGGLSKMKKDRVLEVKELCLEMSSKNANPLEIMLKYFDLSGLQKEILTVLNPLMMNFISSNINE